MENLNYILASQQALSLVLIGILLFVFFNLTSAYVVPIIQKKQAKADLFWKRIKIVLWSLYLLLCYGLLFSANMYLTLAVSAMVLATGWSFWTNFFAGILIRFSNQYKVDDYISTDFVTGKIKAIKTSYTEVVNGKGELLVIPNLQLKNAVLKHLNIKNSPNRETFSCSGSFTREQVYQYALNCPYLTANQSISVEKKSDTAFEIRAMLIDESFKEKVVAYFERLTE